MKFKAAFCYRGLCETEILEATYDNYRVLGKQLTSERGLESEPDYFIMQRGKWLKLDENGEIVPQEFCSADYTMQGEEDLVGTESFEDDKDLL